MEKMRRRFPSVLFPTTALDLSVIATAMTLATQTLVKAHADTGAQASVSYFSYRDWQYAHESRMKVTSPVFTYRLPVSDHGLISGGAVLDTMSGASPRYHDMLSGASTIGISDTRGAGDITYTHTFEHYDVSVSTEYSDEHDYRAKGVQLKGTAWSEDRNTAITAGFGGSYDAISSTNDPSLRENRHTGTGFIGLTHVLDRSSILQTTFTFTSSDGYHSDPYKSFDSRPKSREQYILLTRYNRFFKELGGALHLDLRVFLDSWHTYSGMVDMAWYQPVGKNWMFRPILRLYSQQAASFYSNLFPPDSGAAFYTSDQRMASFGSIAVGSRIEYKILTAVNAAIGYEFFHQNPHLSVLGKGSSAVGTLYGELITAEIRAQW